MEVYVFEKEKTRAFRMERRKHYEHNKKAVEEITKIGNDRQVQAGYSPRFHYPHLDHLWRDAGRGFELTAIISLQALVHGPTISYDFSGEFGTPSSIIGTTNFEINTLEGLVTEIKNSLQHNYFYQAAVKPWFYTFEQQETLYTADEERKAMRNFKENFNSPEARAFLTGLAETEEERQEVAAFLKGETPKAEVQAHNLTSRGLTPEERQEFIKIYNS